MTIVGFMNYVDLKLKKMVIVNVGLHWTFYCNSLSSPILYCFHYSCSYTTVVGTCIKYWNIYHLFYFVLGYALTFFIVSMCSESTYR